MHKLFESQLDSEKIYLVVREHPALLALRLGLLALLALIGIGAHAVIPGLLGDLLTGAGQLAFSLLFYTYYLVLLVGLLFICSFYYLSLQIITDMRMVDVDQAGLFRRKVTEIQIENVEEVTSTAHGLLSTVFNFGNVLVQTSSAQNEFEFENVAKPEQIKKLILDLYEQRRKNHQTRPTPPKV